MEFTDKISDKYNGISAQDIEEFKDREILFYSTQSSCLGSENAVLTLENLQVFSDAMNKFFKRLNGSKFTKYPEEKRAELFYKWLVNFLSENQKTNKSIREIYKGTLLNELKESALIFYFQETK
jgi:GMP synthase PP-ATPase subunit